MPPLDGSLEFGPPRSSEALPKLGAQNYLSTAFYSRLILNHSLALHAQQLQPTNALYYAFHS